MDNDIQKIMDDMNDKKVKKQKVYHSSFSEYNNFSKDHTFEQFDMKTHGAFHGACEVDEKGTGRQVAENRVFVKILEDADQRVGVPLSLRQELIQDHSVDFEKLKDQTGYEIHGKFKNPIMIECEVSYTNAITLNENRTGQWTPYDIVREIMNKIEEGEYIKGFTDADLDDYYDDNINLNGVAMVDLINEEYGDEVFDQDYKEFLFVRDWLESKGYDAIKYQNTFEGDSECIMSFRPENVKITNSYCLKDKLGFKQEEPNQKSKNRPKMK